MFEFGMVKLVILLLTEPFIEFDCSRYRCSNERFFFLLRNIGKIDWTFKSVRAIHGIRGTEVWLYYLYSDKNNRLPFCNEEWSYNRIGIGPSWQDNIVTLNIFYCSIRNNLSNCFLLTQVSQLRNVFSNTYMN